VPLWGTRDLVDGWRLEWGERAPAAAVLRSRAHHGHTRQRGSDPM